MSTTETSIQATVTDGPNATDVVMSLLHAYSPRKHKVHFTIEGMFPGVGYNTSEFDAVITGVRYESGSPGMFLIEFHVASHRNWGACKGFYDAQRRRGTLEMEILG